MKNYVFTGCRTSEWRNARGKGIEIYEIDSHEQWHHIRTVKPEFDNPSWLTFDEIEQKLYVIYGDGENVTEYKFDAHNAELQLIGSKSTGPRHPNNELQPERKNNSVSSELTPDRKSLLIANHEGGNVARLDFDENNELQEPAYFLKITGKNSPEYEQVSLSRPHQIVYDNSKRFLLLPIQGRKAGNGIDMIQVYNVQTRDYQLVDTVEMTTGCWSRHICVHPSNQYIYCVNELGCTVTTLSFNEETGKLKKLQEIRTLPTEIEMKYDVSEINIHCNGKFLYVSNRVHNSISLFYIDTDGTLKFAQHFDCKGKTPRFTTISPNQQFFYSANEDSDNIVQFAINPVNGYLTETGQNISALSPTCIVFA